MLVWTICNSSTAATPTEKSQLKTTEHPPGADDVSKGIDSIDLAYAGLEDSLDPLLLYPHLVLKKKTWRICRAAVAWLEK